MIGISLVVRAETTASHLFSFIELPYKSSMFLYAILSMNDGDRHVSVGASAYEVGKSTPRWRVETEYAKGIFLFLAAQYN